MVSDAKSVVTADAGVVPILEAVRDGKWADIVADLRDTFSKVIADGGTIAQAKKAIDAQKKRFPGILFHGRFYQRSRDHLDYHSGLIVVDLDDLTEQDVNNVLTTCAADPHVVAGFRSPSSAGVKVLVRVQSAPLASAPHDSSALCKTPEAILAFHERAAWAARELVRSWGYKPDDAAKDLARVCFVSHDPDLTWKEAVELPVPEELPKDKKTVKGSNALKMPPNGSLSGAVNLPSQIATAVLIDVCSEWGVSVIDWNHPKGILCVCPGKDLHTGDNADTDFVVHIDEGVPTGFCFHQSCANAVTGFNTSLRSKMGKQEAAARRQVERQARERQRENKPLFKGGPVEEEGEKEEPVQKESEIEKVDLKGAPGPDAPKMMSKTFALSIVQGGELALKEEPAEPDEVLPPLPSEPGAIRTQKELIDSTHEWLLADYRNNLHIKLANGTWANISESGAMAAMVEKGYIHASRLTSGEGELPSTYKALVHIRHYHRVGTAIPVAGWPIGVHRMFDDDILVTHQAKPVIAVEGDWSLIEEFLLMFFGGKVNPSEAIRQFQHFNGLMHLARKQCCWWLNPDFKVPPLWHMLPCTLLTGPTGTGKSWLLTEIMRPLLGRYGKAFNYLSGQDKWNDDLIAAELLSCDDPSMLEYKSEEMSRLIASSVKQLITSPGIDCNARFVSRRLVESRFLLTFAVNLNPESIRALPLFDEDMAGKIMAFLSHEGAFPDDRMQRAEFLAKAAAQLPAYAWHLDHFEIPEQYRDPDHRTIIAPYKHPEVIVEVRKDLTHTQRLLEIDAYFFGRLLSIELRGIASDVCNQMLSAIESSDAHQDIKERLRAVWSKPISIGKALGKLHREKSVRIQTAGKLHNQDVWVVTKPS